MVKGPYHKEPESKYYACVAFTLVYPDVDMHYETIHHIACNSVPFEDLLAKWDLVTSKAHKEAFASQIMIYLNYLKASVDK
jgi:hypothetical protein